MNTEQQKQARAAQAAASIADEARSKGAADVAEALGRGLAKEAAELGYRLGSLERQKDAELEAMRGQIAGFQEVISQLEAARRDTAAELADVVEKLEGKTRHAEVMRKNFLEIKEHRDELHKELSAANIREAALEKTLENVRRDFEAYPLAMKTALENVVGFTGDFDAVDQAAREITHAGIFSKQGEG